MFLIFSSALLWAGEKLNYSAPAVLPHTKKEMQRPGFWIAKHPSPDKVILTADRVQRFNQQLSNAALTKDLLDINAFDIKVGATQIEKELKKFARGDYFDREGKLASRDFFQAIKENINLEDKEVIPRHAFVLRQSDQRLLPTDAPLTAQPFDLEFDEVQNSSLSAGEPVVVFYETLDEKWVYTQTFASAGWVKKESLEFVSADEFKTLLNAEKVAVVISAKADLYRDPAFTQFYDYARMGDRFSVHATASDSVEILIAPGQSLFVKREDIHMGFLSYTPRHILEQAFKMLNEPYGWGGMNGEQDCSAFLKGVFATVGIVLPRNSGEQGKSGTLIKNLSAALPGITVAQLKGHIILYLGMIDGQPYGIHEIFAYRENITGQDRPRVLNRVVVSDLHLGTGSKKGSLLERIVAIREIR